MIIRNIKELEKAKKTVLQMKSQATHPFIISVYDEMLDELNKKGVECLSPSYFSIYRFGYDIFNPLHAI